MKEMETTRENEMKATEDNQRGRQEQDKGMMRKRQVDERWTRDDQRTTRGRRLGVTMGLAKVGENGFVEVVGVHTQDGVDKHKHG